MAKYSITAILGVVSDKMKSGLKSASGSLKKFGAGFKSAIHHPAAQAAIAAGKAIVDFGVEAVQTAGKIDASMNEVFTLLPGMATGAKEKMTKEMMELSAKMGKMPEDMIGSLYNALSAGVPEENVFNFLETAAKASIGGVSTVEEAVGALTTVMNGYKMPAEKAGEVSDTLFTIIKNGVTTMPELAANIGKVTPIAASLGITFDEVGAAFAEITKNLGPGKSAETGTMMKAMFSEMAKGGSKAAMQFERIAGKSFVDFIKGGGTVREAMQMMGKDADSSGKRITDFFGSIEAGQAALILSADGAKGLGEQMVEMGKKSGASTEAFKTVDQGFSRMMEKLMSGFESFKYTVGKALGPVVDVLMPLFLKGLKMIQRLPWDKLGVVIGKNMKMLEPIMEMLFELIEEIFPLIGPTMKMSASLTAIFLPLLAVVIKLLVALMPALVWIIEKVAVISELIIEFSTWLSNLIHAFGKTEEAATDATDSIVDGVGEISDDAKAVIKWFKDAWKWIKGAFKSVWDWIGETVDSIAYFAKQVWTLLSWPFRQIFKFFKELQELVFLLLINIWDEIVNLVEKILDVREWLKEKLFEMFPWLEELVDGIKAFIVETIMSIWWAISDFFEGIWTGIKQLFKDLRESVMSSEGDIAEALQYMWILIEEIVGGAIDLFKKLWEIVKFVGFVIKEIGGAIFGAKSETQDLNKELDETAKKMELVKEETEKTANEAEREEKSRARTLKFEEMMAKMKKKTGVEMRGNLSTAEATEVVAKKGLAQEKLRLFQQTASVQAGAKIIAASGVNVKLLQATIGKHKEVNSMAELYSIIAEGKKTPAQLIEEAKEKQSLLNTLGGLFGIKNSKGQTPVEQLKGVLKVTKEMNTEAAKNPLVKLQKGEMKITVQGGFDKASIKTLLGLMKSIAHTNAAIDKTLKGKFVNQ